MNGDVRNGREGRWGLETSPWCVFFETTRAAGARDRHVSPLGMFYGQLEISLSQDFLNLLIVLNVLKYTYYYC
jgi:hypothetical protein